MDDDQRNVIDGTARARQWRRSRKKTRPDSETSESRSDAPRRIASSLLVPADMVHPASPAEASTDREARATVDPGHAVPDELLTGEAGHRNPFLIEDAAGPAGRSGARRSPTRRSALVTMFLGAVSGLGRRDATRKDQIAAAPRQRLRPRRPTRSVALSVGALAAIALAVGLVTASQTPPHRSFSVAAGGRPLEQLKSGLLSSTANPLAGQRAAPRTTKTRALRTHQTALKPPRSNRVQPPSIRHRTASPTRGASATATTVAHYTPPTATTSPTTTSANAPSYASSGSTGAPAQQPVSQPTAASSTPAQAFGSAGALGPGSSPNG